MLPVFDVYIDFSELLGKKFSFELGPDAKRYIESEATTGRRWNPFNSIDHLLEFFVDSDGD